MTRRAALNRRTILTGSAATLLAGAAPAWARVGRHRGAGRPNILFIMADDMGYADLSSYGGRTGKTPNIDRIAAQGVRLTNGYANSAVCSATRVALITGRYQYRLPVGLEEVLQPTRPLGLPAGTHTLPKLMKGLGYRTSLIGKWHLGIPPEFGPLKSGYDSFYGTFHGGNDYFEHSLRMGIEVPWDGIYDGLKPVHAQGRYLTDLFTDRADAEIVDSVRLGQPFFMSLHYTAPHWPWQGPNDAATAGKIANARHSNGGSIAKYAEMIASLDANVGRLLARLDQLGIADNTIVVFTSDNGGERYSDMWPLLGAKCELLEGGIRVPLAVRWPAAIPAGYTCGQTMLSMDFLPTLIAAAGGQVPDARQIDGVNLLPVLMGKQEAIARSVFWRMKDSGQRAHRKGDMKYLRITDKEYLFNLAEDEHEQANLRDDLPDVFATMKAEYASWDASMLPYPPDSAKASARSSKTDRY